MKLKKLVPQDYLKYKKFFSQQRYELCCYSLASILAWSNQAYQPYGQVLDDCLIVGVEFKDPAKPNHLILPISPDREYSPEELHHLAIQTGYDAFQFVPDDYLKRYDSKSIAALFRVQPHPEYHDYVYRTGDLARLKGNKYSKKRNLINQFKSEYIASGRVQVEKIHAEVTSECLDFLEEWCLARDCDRHPEEDLACEKIAAINVLENFETMELKGLLIRVDGHVSAFGIAALLTAHMGVLHFEKAYTDIKGLYQYLDQQCARRLVGNRQFINKESDMGLAGLAQAKKSYYPTRMVKSYQLTVR
jgi:hypothetical protein